MENHKSKIVYTVYLQMITTSLGVCPFWEDCTVNLNSFVFNIFNTTIDISSNHCLQLSSSLKGHVVYVAWKKLDIMKNGPNSKIYFLNGFFVSHTITEILLCNSSYLDDFNLFQVELHWTPLNCKTLIPINT